MSLATGLYFLTMLLFTRAHSYKHPAQTKLRYDLFFEFPRWSLMRASTLLLVVIFIVTVRSRVD